MRKASITMPAASGTAPQRFDPDKQQGHWKLQLLSKKLAICPRLKKILELTGADANRSECVLGILSTNQFFKLIREYRLAVDSGSAFDITLRVVTCTDKIKWIRVSGMPYHRRWGVIEHMIGMAEDITQQIKEERLGIAVINHELRNPLTIVKLNNQQVRRLLHEEGYQRPVKLLDRADEHLNGITRILDEYLTHPLDEPRSPQLNYSVFELNLLIDAVLDEIRTAHPGYRFVKEDSEQVWVNADRYKIVQVLINYLSNAVNFSPSCSRIRVGLSFQLWGAEVAIYDEGIGIPEGQEENIFGKFYRCNTKPNHHRNGKGLGLYLVKKIINAHGGLVRAERTGKRGSAFYFSLPSHPVTELPGHEAIAGIPVG